MRSGATATPGGTRTVRDVSDATTAARMQEGELSAVRRQLERSERSQQVLIEQLTAERQEHAVASRELNALRQIARAYGPMREEHAMALEMLGEKEEELEALKAAAR